MITEFFTEKTYVKMYQGLSGFNFIKEDWRQLQNKIEAKRYFHFVEWYESYIKHIEADPDSLLFFTLYKNNTIQAILPFKQRKRPCYGINFSTLELFIHPHFPLRDIIFPECYQSNSSIQQLINELQKEFSQNWDVIDLSGVLADSLALKVFNNGTLSICNWIKPSSYLDINPSEKVFANLSKNMRGALRKQNKKFSRAGSFHTTSIRKYPELKHAYNEFLRLESSGWKGANGTNSAISCHDNLTFFYEDILKNFSKYNASEVNILNLNDKAVSAQLSIVIDDTRYILKIGHDPKVDNLGPGNIHVENVILESEREGLKFINLISNASWHQRWKVDKNDVMQLLLFRKSLKGLFLYLCTKADQLLRPIYYTKIKPVLVLFTNPN